MKIVVVGNGKIGATLIRQLADEKHDIVVVDNDPEALRRTTDALDVMGVEGNGASYSVLREAGADKADLVIAVTSEDELNMLCCIVAKKLGARHTIARVRNPEYDSQMFFLRDELGLSMSINPESACAAEIFRLLRTSSALMVEPFAKGKAELVEIRIKEDSPIAGLSLMQLQRQYLSTVLVCAVQRGEEVVIPNGSFVLAAGDRITIVGAPGEITRFFQRIGVIQRKVRSVLIVGGSRMAYYLARQLTAVDMRVTIIEREEERCRELCELLPEARVVLGDGTDQDVLLEEGLESCDAFVSLTGMDEENLIVAMFAATKGVNRVVAKVNSTTYADMLRPMGLETVVSPSGVTAARIVGYVRGMQHSVGSSMESLHKMVDDRVEALEFRVQKGESFLGISLKDLKLKPEMLLACIVRNGHAFIPGGATALQADDTVIVVAGGGRLHSLSEILA